MKHPVILLELLIGLTVVAVLLVPSVRSLITWDFGFAFVIVLALLGGTALEYRDDHDSDSWKHTHHTRELKNHGG